MKYTVRENHALACPMCRRVIVYNDVWNLVRNNCFRVERCIFYQEGVHPIETKSTPIKCHLSKNRSTRKNCSLLGKYQMLFGNWIEHIKPTSYRGFRSLRHPIWLSVSLCLQCYHVVLIRKVTTFCARSFIVGVFRYCSSHNWNTLFLGANAVADVMAEKYDAKKSDILDPVSAHRDYLARAIHQLIWVDVTGTLCK